ncbi:MAG: hypothetical protein IBJ10_06320 [Phycisphaerales bacterium]|nr:hypothetical protein [Phycisphaerales bacterium]
MAPKPQSVGAPETLRAVILLDSGGAAPPEDLLRSLQNRGVRYEVARSVYAVMGALCEDPANEPPALIVHEPARIPGLDRLRASLARFAPAAPVWQYESEAQPRLQAMPEPKPVPPAEPTPEIVVKARSARPAPALRLAGDFDSLGNMPPAPPPLKHGPEEDPGLSLLSDEELGMLLSDWSDDAPRSTERPGQRPPSGRRGDEP